MNIETYWYDDTKNANWTKEKVGGKAYHLAQMTNWGLPVPRFGVLTNDAYQLSKVSSAEFSELQKSVIQKIQTWNCKYFAVRSSMSLEDGASSSFAGIFETFLFTEIDQVWEKVLECYKSIFSDRALMYFQKKNISPDQLGVSVVIQAMVDAKSSGVAFSRSPKDHSGLIYIEAGLGLGEGVVSGQVEVDFYEVDRFNKVWKTQLSQKIRRAAYVQEEKAVRILEIEDELTKKSCLDLDQINKLCNGILLCENKMQQPADVEWALDHQGEIFFLQTRPITQPFESLNFFADTNLAESYPGLIKEFTANFIPKAYEKVIGETLQLMGMKWNINDSDGVQSILKQLIVEKSGHLYYNLSSYYPILYLFPGGEKNIYAWHDMIGGHRIEFKYKKINLLSGVFRLKPYLLLISYLINHDKIYTRFIKQRFSENDDKKNQVINCKTSFDASLLPVKFFNSVTDWGLTSLNDLFVIVGLKILNSLIVKYQLSKDIITVWLKTNDGVDSLLALQKIEKLKINLKLIDPLREDTFWTLINRYLKNEDELGSQCWGAIFKELDYIGWGDESKMIKEYLYEFGERCFEELKIESMPFSESPTEFFRVFKQNFSEVHSYSMNKEANLEKSQSKDYETLKLNFFDRMILRTTLYYTRKAVAVRESTRLMRGRFYGLLRAAVLKSADLILQENPGIGKKYFRKDFFHITMDEFQLYAEKKIELEEILSFIDKRKKIYLERQEIIYPELYAASIADKTDYFLQTNTDNFKLMQNEIKGVGVSSGSVTGRVLVVFDPRQAIECDQLSECILVTRSTDPAWIFIMSQCRGLISEKGSLLSHTAIVGRELGIPTVVSVADATQILKTGQMISLSGKTGVIQIL